MSISEKEELMVKSIIQNYSKTFGLLHKYDEGILRNQKAIREKLNEIKNFTTIEKFKNLMKEIELLFLEEKNF